MENIMDNREEILKAVKEDGKIYSCLLKVWRNDKEIFKEAFNLTCKKSPTSISGVMNCLQFY